MKILYIWLSLNHLDLPINRFSKVWMLNFYTVFSLRMSKHCWKPIQSYTTYIQEIVIVLLFWGCVLAPKQSTKWLFSVWLNLMRGEMDANIIMPTDVELLNIAERDLWIKMKLVLCAHCYCFIYPINVYTALKSVVTLAMFLLYSLISSVLW